MADITGSITDAWGVVQAGFAWLSEQTHLPIGTILIVSAGVFVVYKFAGLFRRKEK